MRLFARKVSSFASVPRETPPSLATPPGEPPDSARRNPGNARRRSRRRWLGLDIGSAAVKIVELSRLGESYRVEAFAVEPTPAGSVVAGNISDAGAVGEAIRRACSRAGAKPRNVCAGVRNSAVITKTLEMDASLNDRELETEVTLEAERHIPFPLDQVAMDFEPTHLSPSDPSKVNVLLVACRLEHVVQRQEAAEIGGLRLDVVDTESHALQHAAARVSGNRLPVALADIGAATTTVMLLDEQSAVVRDEQFNAVAGDVKNAAFAVDPLLGVLTRLVRLVRLAGPGDAVDRLLLAGGTASMPRLADRVAKHMNMTVEVADVFRGMPVSERIDAPSLEQAAALFTAGALALRGFAQE